jgi:hypothetical protein
MTSRAAGREPSPSARESSTCAATWPDCPAARRLLHIQNRPQLCALNWRGVQISGRFINEIRQVELMNKAQLLPDVHELREMRANDRRCRSYMRKEYDGRI